jgi:phage I-like protein
MDEAVTDPGTSPGRAVLCPSFKLSAGNVEPLSRAWNQVAKAGRFRGHGMGEFEFNAKVYREIIDNFRATANQRVPIDYEHVSETLATPALAETGTPAHAWITALEVRGDELWGLFEWVDPVTVDQVRTGKYQYFSPAVQFQALDRVTGKPIGARITSGAITNNPFLDGMAPLAASDAAARNLSLPPSAVHIDGPVNAEKSTKETHAMAAEVTQEGQDNRVLRALRSKLKLSDTADEATTMGALDDLVKKHETMSAAEAARCRDEGAKAVALRVQAGLIPNTDPAKGEALDLFLTRPKSFAALYPEPRTTPLRNQGANLLLTERIAPQDRLPSEGTQFAGREPADESEACAIEAQRLMSEKPTEYPQTSDGMFRALRDVSQARKAAAVNAVLNGLRGGY